MIEEGELEEDRGIVVVRAWANTAWHRHDAAMGGRGGDTFLCLEYQYKPAERFNSQRGIRTFTS